MKFLSTILSWFRKKPVELKKEISTDVVVSEKVIENKTVASIQFFVTKKMRMQLRDLGYTKFQIEALSPVEASIRIKNQTGPNN